MEFGPRSYFYSKNQHLDRILSIRKVLNMNSGRIYLKKLVCYLLWRAATCIIVQMTGIMIIEHKNDINTMSKTEKNLTHSMYLRGPNIYILVKLRAILNSSVKIEYPSSHF